MSECDCEIVTIRLVGHAAHEDEHDAEVPVCVSRAMQGANEYAEIAKSSVAFLAAQNADLRRLAEAVVEVQSILVLPDKLVALRNYLSSTEKG